MEHVCGRLRVSERRACRVLNQARSTHRYRPRRLADEEPLTGRIVELASQYGRYGYKRIHELLVREGWRVNRKRVERIWRQEGLKVPNKQPKRARLWLTDGSCIRLRPQYRNHVWSYDFVADRTQDGRPLKMLVIMDEFSRECLSIDVERSIKSFQVLERLGDLFLEHGTPEYIRSDNGPEFTAKLVRSWLERLQVGTLFIEPGSPWENGYVESLNARFRDEFLNGELFYTRWEAKVLVERWRREYNAFRPHGSLNYRPPAPETIRPMPPIPPQAPLGNVWMPLT